MCCGPTHGSAQAPVVRQVPDVQWFARVRSSGTCQTSDVLAQLRWRRISGDGRTSKRWSVSDVRDLSDVRSFGSSAGSLVVRSRPVFRWVFRRRTSCPDRSSSGWSFFRGPSSCSSRLVSSPSCPWASSWFLVMHTHMFEVVAMSHIWKVMVRRGASSPCVQWCLVEVSSYVLLGLGE